MPSAGMRMDSGREPDDLSGSSGGDGTFNLSGGADMMSRWASQEFSTDWGTRDLSPSVSFYDPISYHQGSVWPLFTGWVSLFEYRNGRSLSGYAHLMQNADLSWAQDPGGVTELLSGEFFRWFGRSTSHQLWSSAMVITPAVRGMFGLEWNAGESKLTVTPNLPAQWNEARISECLSGRPVLEYELRRTGRRYRCGLVARDRRLSNSARVATAKFVRTENCGSRCRAVEVGLSHGLPEAGER